MLELKKQAMRLQMLRQTLKRLRAQRLQARKKTPYLEFLRQAMRLQML
jgi:hypothetical protein